MKTGFIYPSHVDKVTWAAVSGAWAESYPVSNLGDIINTSKVARASSPAESRTVSGTFSSAQAIQAFAVIGHNALAGDTVRVYCFSGTGNDPIANDGTMVYDSGAVPWWPAGSAAVPGYRQIRPFVLPAPVSCRSFRIIMNNSLNTGVALEVEAIEVGGFFEVPGLGFGRDIGFEAERLEVEYVGGADREQAQRAPRKISGQVDYLALSVTESTGLDFQRDLDTQRPFVFMEDYDNPASWARRCILARNQTLEPMVGRLYRHDSFPVRLIEHFR